MYSTVLLPYSSYTLIVFFFIHCPMSSFICLLAVLSRFLKLVSPSAPGWVSIPLGWNMKASKSTGGRTQAQLNSTAVVECLCRFISFIQVVKCRAEIKLSTGLKQNVFISIMTFQWVVQLQPDTALVKVHKAGCEAGALLRVLLIANCVAEEEANGYTPRVN